MVKSLETISLFVSLQFDKVTTHVQVCHMVRDATLTDQERLIVILVFVQELKVTSAFAHGTTHHNQFAVVHQFVSAQLQVHTILCANSQVSHVHLLYHVLHFHIHVHVQVLL